MFVGGTGRCGTHAVATLAGSGAPYALAPAELRLHACQSGIYPFVAGRRDRDWLVHRLRTHWWRRRCEWDHRSSRGAHHVAPPERYFAAVNALAAAPPGADRRAISAGFIASLLDPIAPSPGAWIEKSPLNCAAADFLDSIFPGMRLIHVIRDGRDVACSFMRVPWAPDDFDAALALWERSMFEAHRGTLAVPPERVHRLTLEDLVVRARDRTYTALLAFLGIADGPKLRSFFDRELTADHARVGRWRSDLPASMHQRANALYRASLQRLGEAGVWPLPLPDGEPDAPALRRSASPIDPWAAATA